MWHVLWQAKGGVQATRIFASHDSAESFCDWVENTGGQIVKVWFQQGA